jgi:ribosomal protein S18 acetylase RimI-like enzyme
MKVVIKTARIEDLKKIQELNLKLFQKEHKEYDKLLNLDWTFGEPGTKYFRDRISKDNGCVLITVVDGKIVGYLCGGIIKGETYRNLPVVAELENMFVLEEYRSRHIGKRLYDEFVKWCKSKGVGKIKVQATAQNELAIKFYRDNDFKDYTLVLEHDL